MKRVRCAIYTRKSSEEGLEQDFNSLDAQHEACAAYVRSQASEGWTLIPDRYDDGGISGGTLERPALQRLLADVAQGRLDIIVVYKVDRLTRSLLDFSRLVEAFDAAAVSFVSVTQSFNTTTSMGRLTLNMLLSFAQFEREVTAERIRDKIAASKARGMWMGGTPPLGYEPDGRSLAVVEEHAAIIRGIYARYLELGHVRAVADRLRGDNVMTPARVSGSGRRTGGGPFSRGQLYGILKNPIYAGDIAHKEKVYPGQHTAIIDRGTWREVQARLADHLQGDRRAAPAPKPSLLAGLVVDDTGAPLVATHACKGEVRYRYYVSRALQHDPGGDRDGGVRLPARDLERAVCDAVADALGDPLGIAAQAWITVTPAAVHDVNTRARIAAAALRDGQRETIRDLVARVQVQPDRVEILLCPPALARLLGQPSSEGAPATLILAAELRLTRMGRAVRLVQTNGAAVGPARVDLGLVKLITRARGWWAELSSGELDVTALSVREGLTTSYVSRVVRLAFLAPEIVEAIVRGQQPAALTSGVLTTPGAMPDGWPEQRRRYLGPG